MKKQLVIPGNNTGRRVGIFPFLLGICVVFVFASCDAIGGNAGPPPIAKARASSTRIAEANMFTLNATASNPAAESTIRSYFWEQIDNGPHAIVLNANTDEASVTAPLVPASLELTFRLTVTGSNSVTASDTVSITIVPSDDMDADGDGLIEIDTLEMLHNMRYNLAGTSYKTSDSATGLTSGCPAAPAGCTGYELSTNLDFDVDGNGKTWTGNSTSGFTLDTADDNDTYFDIAADGTGGWLPIGDSDNHFTATFEGNGRTISNLAIRRDVEYIGLWGYIATEAHIRNIGLIDNLADHSSDKDTYVGGLVGQQDGGYITTSYTTGPVDGGDSHAGDVGGLVGRQDGGYITASYATGAIDGGAGVSDEVGGLVGDQRGSITASYATGTVNGGAGNFDEVGGLVGYQGDGSITASYATGAVSGGAGVSDEVGGLLGSQEDGGSITASYGFGTVSGETPRMEAALPEGLSTATGLTADNAGSAWNNASKGTSGAWDFGTASQPPALKYADYDGPDRSGYSCAPQGGQVMFPTGVCGTFIPGQGR